MCTIGFSENTHHKFGSSGTHQTGYANYFAPSYVEGNVIYDFLFFVDWVMASPVFYF